MAHTRDNNGAPFSTARERLLFCIKTETITPLCTATIALPMGTQSTPKYGIFLPNVAAVRAAFLAFGTINNQRRKTIKVGVGELNGPATFSLIYFRRLFIRFANCSA